MQTNASDRKQNSGCLGAGGRAGPEGGIMKELEDTSRVGAGHADSLELAMVMPKPTKLNIFNMHSVAYVNYGSMTLLVDRDRHVNGAPAAVQGGPGCAGATSPGEKRKHVHRRNSDLPLTSERARVRIQNIPSHSFIRSFTHSFSKRVSRALRTHREIGSLS